MIPFLAQRSRLRGHHAGVPKSARRRPTVLPWPWWAKPGESAAQAWRRGPTAFPGDGAGGGWSQEHVAADATARCLKCGFWLAGTIARISPQGQRWCGRCYWARTESTATDASVAQSGTRSSDASGTRGKRALASNPVPVAMNGVLWPASLGAPEITDEPGASDNISDTAPDMLSPMIGETVEKPV